jgi:sortase (surface protein transpeptidase)
VVGGPREKDARYPAAGRTVYRGGIPGWMATTRPAPVPPPVAVTAPNPTATPKPKVVAKATVAPKPKVAPKAPVAPKPKVTPKPAVAPASYRGTNHMWIPALGVNRSVSFYSCSRSTALANVVYRWGCGGSNNVYLMGHASGVFRPLYNAYTNGRLRKGMQVIYADASGRITKYAVTFWKVVSPYGAEWAYASQDRPSLTLQTCVGARSQSRLVVRLVATG